MQAIPTLRASLLALGSFCLFAAIPAVANEPTPPAASSSADAVDTAVSEAAAAETAEADDYEWFPADNPGLRYRIHPVRKIDGAWKMMGEDRVRLPRGIVLEVVDQDDEFLYVKHYEWVNKPEKRIVTAEERAPSEEMKAERAKLYLVDSEVVDTLSFEAFDRGLPRQGQWRNNFDVADMNGDGHADIVFNARRKDQSRGSGPVPNIFLGDGEGNWRIWSEAKYPRNQPFDYGGAAAGDFNGDGHQDLALGIHLSGMMVLVGDGKGKFELWSEGIGVDFPGKGGDATSFSSRALEARDWDGDGRLDILALGEGPKGTKTREREVGFSTLIDNSRGFLVYRNNGDGTWTSQRPTEVTNRLSFGDKFAAVDLDSDGQPELVNATRQMGNRGILAAGKKDETLAIQDLEGARPNGITESVASGDFDQDGNQDLVIGYRNRDARVWRTGIDVLFGDGALGFTRVPVYAEEARIGIPAMAVGDADRDGRPDIAALTGNGEVILLLGRAERTFAREELEATPDEIAGCRGFDVHLTDLDGEEGVELVASFAGEPTGMPGMEGLSKPGCPGQGAIRAWKIGKKTGAASTR